jgi:type III secretion protein S
MSQADATQFVAQALWLALLLSGPPVVVAALVGLVVAILQAATQVQEQTLPYALKLLAIVLMLSVMASTFGGALLHYTDRVFNSMPRSGQR